MTFSIGPAVDASYGYRAFTASFVWCDYAGACYAAITAWKWCAIFVFFVREPKKKEELSLVQPDSESEAQQLKELYENGVRRVYTMDEINEILDEPLD